ncbi:MAG: hypothetical protein FWF50_01345 [Defluviitaleaceae bacterium]|nr:hypothetical protein [Defluviitaleaceae bacterium]
MALKINLESTVIPIEIGDLKFEINVTDENYSVFNQVFSKFLEDIESLSEAETEDLELIKEKQKLVYDALLGEGAFEKIYAISPSVIVTTGVLTKVIEHLEAEVSNRLDAKKGKNQVKKSVKSNKVI